MIYEYLKNKYKSELQPFFEGTVCLGPVKVVGKPDKIGIAPGSILCHPSKSLLTQLLLANDLEREEILSARKPIEISNGSIIGPYSVIYEGVKISKNVYIEGRCIIRNNSTIRENTSIYFGAYIGENVTVGCRSKIGGFVCNDAIIGNNCAVLGNLVHCYPQPGLKCREPAPLLKDNVLVSMNANIIGGIVLGDNCRISAGTTVLKDVSDNNLVNGLHK
ncbi:MAG: hypothetical protein U5L07_00830 [Desulfobacterales bacterium]|nr:hypothetical protein [Desulfobacterales bacterium]